MSLWVQVAESFTAVARTQHVSAADAVYTLEHVPLQMKYGYEFYYLTTFKKIPGERDIMHFLKVCGFFFFIPI